MKSPSGMTLIELLLVIAIIGITTAVALPKLSANREATWESQMKKELHRVKAAQDAHFADPANDYRYAPTVLDLEISPREGVAVTIRTTVDGYIAVATHSALPPSRACTLFAGSVAEEPATEEGVVACRE